MNNIGCMNLVMRQIGGVKDTNFSAKDPETVYIKGILPGVTVLGSQLLSVGTQKAQASVVSIFKKACNDISIEQRFFDGLKSILRFLRDDLEICTDAYLILPQIEFFVENMIFQLSNFFND